MGSIRETPESEAPEGVRKQAGQEAAKHTPGPWRWEINLKSRQVQLCGGDPKSGFGAYDHTVMDFVRWGMHGAQPRFINDKQSLLEAAELHAIPVKGREHHQHWFQTLSHPDARLIEAAPDLLEALKAVSAILEGPTPPAAEMFAAMDRARSAIAKAEGAEQ